MCHSLLAQSNAQEDGDVSALVLMLDDVDPKVRQRAETDIMKLGETALPALKKGIQQSSPEVRRRCTILFEKIELQRKRRISKVFLAEDSDEKELAAFRDWVSFSKFVDSSDMATRKMFLNMCDQIPLAFADYQIKGERTAAELRQLARLMLIANKHPRARSESIVVAYLFLFDQAKKLHADSDTELFSQVEVLEGISFFSSNNKAAIGRGSNNRKVIDRVVARWVKDRNPFESSTQPSRLKLIFHTSNLELIAGLEKEYESMDPATRLKYVDIVSKAFNTKDKTALKQTWRLLQKPLADDTVVASSRYRRRPAEKVDVTPKLLAEAKLADLLRITGENASQIEVDTVFGTYPLSYAQFSIVKKENDRQSLTRRVQARIAKSIEVK